MMYVVPVRLDASDSLINGHITPLQCEQCGLPLPGICDCDGERNGCGGLRKFRASRAAVFDASAALSCYADSSGSVDQLYTLTTLKPLYCETDSIAL